MNGAERLALMAAHHDPDHVHPLLLSWDQYCACSASVPELPAPERSLGAERWEPSVVGDRVVCWPTAAMLDAVEASIGGPHLDLRAALAAARACPVVQPSRRTVYEAGSHPDARAAVAAIRASRNARTRQRKGTADRGEG